MLLEKAHDHETHSVRSLGWPYFVLVMIHLASNLAMQQPFILADELGYLGNARYLAGVAHLPDMQGTQFYHFGYSLFLIPAFWLFSNPVWIYKTVMVVNALLASSLIVPLFFILTGLFRVPGTSARWVAFACCVYPSLILYSSFAWSESAYVMLYATAMALFGWLLSTRSVTAAMLFGGVTAFLYTVHPRGMPVVAAAIGYLLLLALLRSLTVRQLVPALSAMAAVLTITRIVNGHLKALAWGGEGDVFVHKLAGRVIPDSDFLALLERLSGQLLYMGQASQGFAILGLIGALGLITAAVRSKSLRAAMSNPLIGTVVLTMVSSGGVLVASAASKVHAAHGPHGVRGGALIYGRYNEALAVLLTAFALALWLRRENGSTRVAWRAVAVIAIMFGLTLVVMAEIDDALVRHVADTPAIEPLERIPPAAVPASSAPGIYPLVVVFGGLEIGAVSLVSVLVFALISGAMRVSERLGIGLLMVSFLSIATANYWLFQVPAMEQVKPRLRFVELISKLGPIDRLGYDTGYFEGSFFRGIQYLMQDTVFVRFNSRQGEVPQTDAVISGRNWRRARTYGAKFFVSASQVDNALWLMPGELQSEIPLHAPYGELLGPQPAIGVRYGGFGRHTLDAARPGRWTKGSAAIKVNVDPRNPPRMLGVDIGPTRRDGVRFELRVNGVTLWDGAVPRRGAAATFDLGRVPIHSEYTIAFIHHPAGHGSEQSGGSAGRPQRVLFVRHVRLEGYASLGSAVVEGLTLGAAQVLGVPESGFYGPERFDAMPARWTNGTARLRILLDPRHLPTRLEVATAAPNRDGALLRVTANGVDLWSGPIPPESWSQSFDLAGVPMRKILNLELASDTFRPADTIEGSTDPRTLGVMVRSIRLSAEAAAEDREWRRISRISEIRHRYRSSSTEPKRGSIGTGGHPFGSRNSSNGG